MSKKVKCIECENMMLWALPTKVDDDNYEYAKHCLVVAKRSCICGWTNKQKLLNNEQYCKYFIKREHEHSNEQGIKKLEDAIAEYENRLMCQ